MRLIRSSGRNRAITSFRHSDCLGKGLLHNQCGSVMAMTKYFALPRIGRMFSLNRFGPADQ